MQFISSLDFRSKIINILSKNSIYLGSTSKIHNSETVNDTDLKFSIVCLIK